MSDRDYVDEIERALRRSDVVGDDGDYVGIGGTGEVEIHDEPIHLFHDGAKYTIAEPREDEGQPFKSDWEEAVAARDRAMVGPNNEHLDDFNQLWQLQQAQNAATAAAAPPVSTNPPSVTSAILGGQATLQIPMGSFVDQAQEVCAWQGADDSETTSAVVTLGAIGLSYFSPNGSGVLPIRPYALVSVGTRGYLIQIRVDIGPGGCQFNVAGSQVRVQVCLDAASQSWAGITTTPTVPLTAMISFKTIYRESPITCTQYISALAANTNSAVTPVPVFAKTVRVAASDAPSTFTLYALDSSGNLIESIAGGGTSLIPLSGDCAATELHNNGPNTSNARLIFGLEL